MFVFMYLLCNRSVLTHFFKLCMILNLTDKSSPDEKQDSSQSYILFLTHYLYLILTNMYICMYKS